MRGKSGRGRVFVQDGKKNRRPKEELEQEMLRLKEGREDEAETQKELYFRNFRNEIFKRPTAAELELEKQEHEEKRKKLLELFKPKAG